MKKTLTSACLLLGFMTATAQEKTLTVDVQLRTRAEYRNGAITPRSEGDKPATFVNERARLGVSFERSNLTLRMAAQHTGVWGQDPQVDKQGRMALNEAWARLTFGEGFFVQVGRQPLVYDDERLLGALDWDVAGRSHDALKAGYSGGRHEVHAIVAVNANDESTKLTYYDATKGQPYKSMQTVWYHYDGHEWKVPFDVSVLFMNLGFEEGSKIWGTSNVKTMQTFGTHFNVMPPVGGLKLTGSFYYQMGNNTSAWLGCVKAAYKIGDTWSAHAAYDYVSGDDGTGDGKYNAFNPLYGTHHNFYGSMDYFYASPFRRVVYNYGLQDIQVGVQSKILPLVPMQLTYHYFATAAKLQGDILGLGHELDYQLSFNVAKGVSISAGYSFMLGKHTLDILKGGDHQRWQDWGWAMLNVKL